MPLQSFDQSPFKENSEVIVNTPISVPVTKSDGGFWILIAFIGFVVGQLCATLLILVAGNVAGKSATQMAQIAKMAVPPEWFVGVSLAGLWVGFFGASWAASHFSGTKRLVADIGIRFKWIDFIGIPIGVACQFLVVVLYAPFSKYIVNFNAPAQKLTGGSHGWGFLVIAILTVIGAPFMEELIFRGVLLKGLLCTLRPRSSDRRYLGTIGVVSGVAIDSLLFGLAHGELVQLAGLALFGAVLATISYRTSRLGMNIVAHASFNLAAILVILNNRTGVIH